MKNFTRNVFQKFINKQAELNGISPSVVGSTSYAVAPSVAQTMEKRIQESSAFLSLINQHVVPDQQGERLLIGINTSIASTTDTSGDGERKPIGTEDIDGTGYHCKQIDSDTFVRYAVLDMWAKFPDFQVKYRDNLLQQMALDRICIGFNGVKREKNSDRERYPLLEDVAVGWLQKLRINKPESVISGIKIGLNEHADYKNIDSCVMAAKSANIAVWHKKSGDLVVICGENLLDEKYITLADDSNSASEKKAFESIATNRMIGGLRAITAPSFPENSFLITSLNNLSIYIQEGSRRRHIDDNAKKNRVEDYNSSNEDFVVEDYDKMTLIEKIELIDESYVLETEQN